KCTPGCRCDAYDLTGAAECIFPTPSPQTGRATLPSGPRNGASAPRMSVARSGERVLGSADAQLGGAGGPGSPALRRLGLLGDVDLLGTGGLVRGGGVLAAPEGLPGGAGELQSAVVPIAGVDRPVAAGLALGQTV